MLSSLRLTAFNFIAVTLLSAGSVDSCTAENITADKPSGTTAPPQLSPLPDGIAELNFREFFQLPAGPLGLEPTPKLLQLDDRKVRIVGYMAQEEEPTAGLFIFSPLPVNVAEKSDGMADDLPAARLSVHMPKEDAEKVLAYRPGLWVLTGTLQLGNREEANGRTAYARLLLDKKDAAEALRKKPITTARN